MRWDAVLINISVTVRILHKMPLVPTICQQNVKTSIQPTGIYTKVRIHKQRLKKLQTAICSREIVLLQHDQNNQLNI